MSKNKEKIDKTKINKLLSRWRKIITFYEDAVNVIINPFYGRMVKQDAGKKIIVNKKYYVKIKIIQKQLCSLLPKYKDTILAEPELDGEWKVQTYVSLFFSHFRMIVDKLQKFVNEQEDIGDNKK